MTGTGAIQVDGRHVQVSSLDRVLFPSMEYTKADLIEYYVKVSDPLLSHLRGRPITLHRYPEGVEGPHFFQTRCPPHPEWVRTATMSFPRTGKEFAAAVIDDLAGLVWAANLSTIELHPFLARLPDLAHPVEIVFDLDPGPPAGLADACAIALRVRDLLSAAGLRGWPKVSGGKGVHVHVPLNTPVDYASTKAFARRVAHTLARELPDRVVATMTRDLRPGKVFVDWSQNDPGKSTVAPYSLRSVATMGGLVVPTVAAPLTWDEVVTASRGEQELVFAPADSLARLDVRGDLMADAVALRQGLPGGPGSTSGAAGSRPPASRHQ